jgi:hypothetical protein
MYYVAMKKLIILKVHSLKSLKRLNVTLCHTNIYKSVIAKLLTMSWHSIIKHGYKMGDENMDTAV